MGKKNSVQALQQIIDEHRRCCQYLHLFYNWVLFPLQSPIWNSDSIYCQQSSPLPKSTSHVAAFCPWDWFGNRMTFTLLVRDDGSFCIITDTHHWLCSVAYKCTTITIERKCNVFLNLKPAVLFTVMLGETISMILEIHTLNSSLRSFKMISKTFPP